MKNRIQPEQSEAASKEADDGDLHAVPPFNDHLDPDNAVSPHDFEEREEEGERKFYPEGGPEDPPVDTFKKS